MRHEPMIINDQLNSINLIFTQIHINYSLITHEKSLYFRAKIASVF